VRNRWQSICPSCVDAKAERAGMRYCFAVVQATAWSDIWQTAAARGYIAASPRFQSCRQGNRYPMRAAAPKISTTMTSKTRRWSSQLSAPDDIGVVQCRLRKVQIFWSALSVQRVIMPLLMSIREVLIV
jgi:hypothetical protein